MVREILVCAVMLAGDSVVTFAVGDDVYEVSLDPIADSDAIETTGEVVS